MQATLATSVYKDILVDNGVSVDTYDTAEYELTFWISNDEMSGSSADAEAGDGVYLQTRIQRRKLYLVGRDGDPPV